MAGRSTVQLRQDERPQTSGGERKRGRKPKKGEVYLFPDDSPSAIIVGRLINKTEGRFWVCHSYRGFHPGQTLRFWDCYSEGEAVVVWSRVFPEGIETSFVRT